MKTAVMTLAAALLAAGCAQLPQPPQQQAPVSPARGDIRPQAPLPPAPLQAPTEAQLGFGQRVGLDAETLTALLNKPLYQMKPAELGKFLAYEQLAQPALRQRIADLARRNIGQPYELYLLGEFPYETFDTQPLFSLDKSDCVVFSEHIYAMAQSASWEEFFWMLQRIRYKDGVIGVATRNHYTEADWNINNRWLVSDITQRMAGARAVPYLQNIDRQGFLRKQFKIEREIPVQRWDDVYVPKQIVAEVANQLQDGDFVNIISGYPGQPGGAWASHVGLIVLGADGERHILHSSEPVVREESLQDFIARLGLRDQKNIDAGLKKPQLLGFKFLRLNDQPEPPPMKPQPRPGRPA
ncbi:N-acetylmuramoyl-L-alanine amidase-like domain-containing protein [Pelomonas sp. KK5]|uniref:N-acetylmuramoyl-L-alanine amidase-like domain-containing protein n=1 Tax=Pelomonas sp. KK5 TaxID=1855730 RepID=UPI001E2DC426|nr:N-acetylmuramoyl-L-alanine amidase-like domain-containing protein [Pelomonas sp. KK5]